MTSGATYFKYSIWLLAIIAVFVLLKWTGCICNKSAHSGNDTLSHKIDTFWKKEKDTVYVPYEKLVPYKVTYFKDRVLHDTLETIETILEHVDSARILAQYLATKYYYDSSAVTYGKAYTYDTVTQNRIIGRKIVLNQNIPLVKETTVLSQPKRIVLFAGLQAFGNKDHLPYASGVTLDLQLKNGGMIGGGAYLTQDKPMYSGSIKFPIRLKKRR